MNWLGNKNMEAKNPLNLTGKTLKIYWQHSKKYPWTVFTLVSTMIIATMTALWTPFLYKNFFNILALGNLGEFNRLSRIIVVILVINLLGWLAYRIENFFTTYFESSVMRDLLNTCFTYVQKHSYGFFANNFSGTLQRRVNRYSRSYEDIADMFLWEATPNILRVAGIIIILLYKYWVLGLGILVWSILHTTFNYYFTQYRLRYDLRKSQTDSEISGFLADTIVNNINIKIFTNFLFEARAFRDLTEKWRRIARKSWDLDAWSFGVQGLLMALTEFLAFYISLRYWRAGKFNIGDFVFIQSYVLMTFNNVWNFSRYLKRFYESMADANEMTEILLTTHEVKDAPGAKELAVSRGEIEFKNVNYSYHEELAVYKKFNLTIKAGEKVAVIGPSGGGKTTLVKLLLRFYDLDSGAIKIDGHDIAKVTQDSLRENIGFVPQDPILFHRSIMENMRYARPDASDEQVYEAARLAHCDEFIAALPQKYNTFVGERGIKLSGGERQRVAIARAILKNAPILVLDEATSSLDSYSERLIQDALKNLMANKTVIVIAHRLSTVMQMDRIIVIEGGKITEQGKHKELLKLEEGTYQKLWNIQAGGFADAA